MRHFLVFLLLLSTLPASGQFSLTGTVSGNNGGPLPGATIYLHELKKGVVSDAAGAYRFDNLRPGHYHLHTQYIGHIARTIDIEIGKTSLRYDIVLQPSSLELREIIVESDLLKLDEKGQSQSVEVVGAEQIRKYNGITLMQSLERLPGINSINTGIGVSKPVIRGLSFNRVAVTDQGIRQEGQQWGLDHGLEIDQFGVGRVEIIKGPASLLYGSDAMAGVVQIKAAPFPMEGKTSAQLSQLYRSVNNQYGMSAEFAGHHHDFVWRMRGTLQDYGDYSLPADSFRYNRFTLALPDRQLKNTAGTEQHGSITGGVQKPWGFSQLTFSRFHQQIGYFAGALGRPLAYQLVPDGNSRNIDLPRQQLTHSRIVWNSNVQLGNNWLEADLGYQHNQREEHSYPHAHGRQQLDSSNTLAHGLLLQTATFNLRFHWRLDSLHRLVAGMNGQAQWHHISGYEFLVPDYKTAQSGIFALWQFKKSTVWQWNAGLRVDVARMQSTAYSEILADGSVRVRAVAVNRFFSNLSGSAGVSWNPTPLWQIKANLGSSFRMPAIPELTSNGVHHGSFRHETGDVNLEPERGYQLDLGLVFRQEKMELKVSPYASYYQHYIYLRPTGLFSFLPDGGQLYRYEQAPVFHTGTEVSAEFHWIKSFHMGISGAYTWLTNLETGVPLPFTPPLQAMLDMEYSFRSPASWLAAPYVGVDLQLFAAQNRVDRNEATTPSYSLINLHLGSELVWKKQKAEVRLLVNNLFDTPYLNHLSRYRLLNLPEPGRNVQLMLHIPIG